MKQTYTIGVDFGTESGRVLLVDVATGNEIANHVISYKHGVLDKALPNGRRLETDWVLQHPGDYLDVLYEAIPETIRKAEINPKDVIGIGIDFTSCTILPLDQQGNPLCFDPTWSDNPHSWVKLWKHHAAHKEADELTQLAEERKEPFLSRYGGKISSEWMFPKVLQIVREAPDVFDAADFFMEACDWLTYKLTNNLIRSSNTCGYKALWNKEEGYPNSSFFKALDERLETILETKMRGQVLSIADKAGELTKEMADRLHLPPGIAVAVGMIDAHAGVPAVGAVHPGQFVMTMGTSTCHMLISDKEEAVEGICGIVEDGIIPGYFSYETGQVAVGDSFAWFVENAVPSDVKQQAETNGISIHQLLEEKAAVYQPGQSGLVALDWLNGNRSVLVDANLSGLLVGLSLSTKPEEIYRALLESTAFGTRKIIENYTEAGVEVNEVFACGGLPQRNKLLMQIYADVLNREIKIPSSDQTVALGAAMYAAVAAGEESGGYTTIVEAAEHMAKVKEETFIPIPEHVEMYDELYQAYLELHDYFGRSSRVMQRLKSLRMNR